MTSTTATQFLIDEELEHVHLADANPTMPKQVSAVLWANRTSPLHRCFRVYIDGTFRGIIGQESFHSPWQATRANDTFGETFPTRQAAIHHVAPEAIAEPRTTRAKKEPKMKKNPQTPEEGKVTATELPVGARLYATYKKAEYVLSVAGNGFLVTDADGSNLRGPFKSLSMAGRAVTGAACNGRVFWKARDAAPTEPVAEVTPEPVTEADADESAEAEAARKARNAKKNAARARRNATKGSTLAA